MSGSVLSAVVFQNVQRRAAQAALRLLLAILILLAAAGSRAQNVEQVGQVGGGATAVAVQGHLAYLVQGPNLTVLDVTQPAQPRWLAEVQLERIGLRIVAEGPRVYVAGRTSVEIIDVSRPNLPRWMGAYRDLKSVRGLAVQGFTVFVADATRLLVLDAGAPPRITLKGVYDNGPNEFGNIKLVRQVLIYAATRAGLLILDVSQPTRPTFKNLYTGSDKIQAVGAEDLLVQGDLVYLCAAAGVLVIDLMDLDRPLMRGGCIGLRGSGLAGGGGVICLADRNHRLVVLDTANPDQPLIRAARGGGYWTACALDKGLCYAVDPFFGLKVMELAEPARPRPVGSFKTDCPQEIKLDGGLAYVANGGRGLEVFDIKRTDHPWRRGTLTSGGEKVWTQGVALSGGQVFAADQFAGLQIVSAQDPDHLQLLGAAVLPGPALKVAVDNHMAYVAAGEAGLQVLDVTRPDKIRSKGSFWTEGEARDVAVRGNTACLLSAIPDWRGEALYGQVDVLDARRLLPLDYQEATYALPGVASLFALDRWIYMAGGQNVFRGEVKGNEVAGLADGWSLDDPATMEDVVVREDRIYVADSTNGLLIFDTQPPRTSSLIAAWPLPEGHAKSVALDGAGNIYLASEVGGITVLRYAARRPVTVTGLSRPRCAVGRLTRGGGQPGLHRLGSPVRAAHPVGGAGHDIYPDAQWRPEFGGGGVPELRGGPAGQGLCGVPGVARAVAGVARRGLGAGAGADDGGGGGRPGVAGREIPFFCPAV